VDFARLQVEGNALQRAHGAEGFGHGCELKQNAVHGRGADGEFEI
jgi:hypothetical protein